MKMLQVKGPHGKDYYINPACIEAVGLLNNGQTKIYMRGDNFYTPTSVEDVVSMIEGDSSPEELPIIKEQAYAIRSRNELLEKILRLVLDIPPY